MLIVFSTNLTASEKMTNYQTNRLYIIALELRKNNYLQESLDIFNILFEQNKNWTYLSNILDINFLLKDHNKVINMFHLYKERFHDKQMLYHFYILALYSTNQLQKAKDEQYKLLSHYDTAQNNFYMADILSGLGEFYKAKLYFEKSLSIKKDNTVLMQYSSLLYFKLNQKEKAITVVEDYMKETTYDTKLNFHIIKLANLQNNRTKILQRVKKSYIFFKQNHKTYDSIDNITVKILSILNKNDIENLIKFFEENKIDSGALVSLYLKQNRSQEAFEISTKLYKDTKDIKYLAILTMIEYDKAKEKNKILDKTIKNFEKVLKEQSSSYYLNFLGYLLVDHDIDIKKGANLISKAVIKNPTNIAYLDSLAWAYYKQNLCKKAKDVMHKIYKLEKITNETIIDHNEKIRNCK
ncbi:MAG: hypothetical protein B1H07_00100 [Campylobacteraceae bacterium 4484_166]|nr:MAG: hypothetical protein B1H07_00100 [Campylobacteraceae bacterium 4484_166]